MKPGHVNEISNLKMDAWVGQVIAIGKDREGEAVLIIEWDADSLEHYSEKVLNIFAQQELDMFSYGIGLDEVEPCEQRNTYEEIEQIQDALDIRIEQIKKGDIEDVQIEEDGFEEGEEWEEEDDFEELDYELEAEVNTIILKRWLRHFRHTDEYYSLSKPDRYHVNFALEVFTDYMLSYEGEPIRDWSGWSAQAVLGNIIPSKVSGERDFFEAAELIYPRFFQFLKDRGYHENADDLIAAAELVKGELVRVSQDPSNWGMAKMMLMGAINKGIDPSDHDAMNQYMEAQRLQGLQGLLNDTLGNSEDDELPTSKPQYVLPRQDPYNNIGRNQKITVAYYDGKIVADVKFKKVEKDLRAGLCKLVKT